MDGKQRFEDFCFLMKLSRPGFDMNSKTAIILKILFFSNTYSIKEKGAIPLQ